MKIVNCIERLKEIKSIKLSTVSAKKRPTLRENRLTATYILDNWDDAENLEKLLCSNIVDNIDEVGAELLDIAYDRETQLLEAGDKKSTAKADDKVQPKVKASKTARKVGDVHPKHSTWVWTEYKPGKFDWRINPEHKTSKRTRNSSSDDDSISMQENLESRYPSCGLL